jgi:hypothetical protein
MDGNHRGTASGSSLSTEAERLAIDCPPAQVKEAVPAPSGGMGTPSGTGTGSGIAARPSEGGPQGVEGDIKQIESRRTERGIRVGDVQLWVEPTQRSSLTASRLWSATCSRGCG